MSLTPERRAEAARLSWSPERRAAQRARIEALNADTKFKAAKGERGRKQLLDAWTDPAFRDKATEGARHGAFRRHHGLPKDVACPSWVPKDLQFEFYQIAGLSDEIESARHMRRMKREAIAGG